MSNGSSAQQLSLQDLAVLREEPSDELRSVFTEHMGAFKKKSYPMDTDLMNGNAIMLPTVSHRMRDTSMMNEARLPGEYGSLSRTFRFMRKADTQLNYGEDGVLDSTVRPTTLFGREAKAPDAVSRREEEEQRARQGMNDWKKREMVPEGTNLKPWTWNNPVLYGEGVANGPGGVLKDMNWKRVDPDVVRRRLNKPAPSRVTKMIPLEIEDKGMRQSRTYLSPMEVVRRDKQPYSITKMPRNVDVREHIINPKGVTPRGMLGLVEAMPIREDTDVLRKPIANGETGDKSVLGIWTNQFRDGPGFIRERELQDQQMQRDRKFVREMDLEDELEAYERSQTYWRSQGVRDPHQLLS